MLVADPIQIERLRKFCQEVRTLSASNMEYVEQVRAYVIQRNMLVTLMFLMTPVRQVVRKRVASVDL